MSWFGEALGSSEGRKSLLEQEKELETHLDVILVWISHETTVMLAKQLPAAKQLLDKITSQRNTIAARLRILQKAIAAYEQNSYQSIVTSRKKPGKENITSTTASGSLSAINSVKFVMYTSAHAIDAFSENLERDVNSLNTIVKTSPRTRQHVAHLSVLLEAVKLFSQKFKREEQEIDSLQAEKPK